MDSMDRSTWIADPARSLLSQENLAAVADVLARPGGVVFGWHYHFAGGANRSDVCFVDEGQYLRSVERARPGDHLTLYDLEQVAPLAFLRAGEPNVTGGLVLTDVAWSRVFGSHDPKREEHVFLRRFVGPLTGEVEAKLLEPTTPEDGWLVDLRHELMWGRGEIFVWAGDVFDETRDGFFRGVTPDPGDPRLHVLVDAKRPNLDGKVPLSGPY